MAENLHFADYVTSGAFTLHLSRHQVSAINLMAQGDHSSISAAALERKGLAVAVANPAKGGQLGMERRLTHAGLLCAKLLVEAGLSNGPADPIAEELAALRADLEAARQETAEARQRATAAWARKEAAERQLATANALLNERASGVRLKAEFQTAYVAKPVVSLRDPLPHLTDAELAAELEAPHHG